MSEKTAVYVGSVVDVHDPAMQGRVRVSIPELGDELWALRATPVAGVGYGAWLPPSPGDEVLIEFRDGDPAQPILIGSLWGTGGPPETDPERTVLKTKHGVTLVLHDGTGSMAIEDANGNAVRLGADGVTVTAASRVTVAGGRVEVDAATVQVNAATAKFTGIVQCDTLIASSVVSASYTPGAGNEL